MFLFPTLYIKTFAGTFYHLGICNTFLKVPKRRQKRPFVCCKKSLGDGEVGSWEQVQWRLEVTVMVEINWVDEGVQTLLRAAEKTQHVKVNVLVSLVMSGQTKRGEGDMELTEEWENADKTLGVQPGEVKHGLTSG